MNILFLTRRSWPDIGGVETHVGKITGCLLNDGHNVTIIAEHPTRVSSYIGPEIDSKNYQNIEKYPYNIKKGKLTVLHIPAHKDDKSKKFRIWLDLYKYRNYIQNSDIIHCHDVFFWYFPFKLLYPSKKVFITFHGYEGKYPVSTKAILIRRISARMANGNICIGKFIEKWYGTKADIITYGAAEKIYRDSIYPGHSRESGNPVSIIQRSGSQNYNKPIPKAPINKLTYDKINILFIGRLDDDTGIKIYLDGINILRKILPVPSLIKQGISFEACGDGKYRQEAGKLGKVHGFVDNVDDYIRKADIILASSYLSILQALSYRKKVIAVYDNPLKKDYLQMSPFADGIDIVSTPEEVANAISHNTKDPKKADIAIKWVINQTWRSVTDQYYKLWEKA